jgi:hypothetical protein
MMNRIRRYSKIRQRGGDPLSEDERDTMLSVVEGTLDGSVPLGTANTVNETFKQINNNRNSDYNMAKMGVDANKKAELRRSLETISEARKVGSAAKKKREAGQ